MKVWTITIVNAFGIDEKTIDVQGHNLLIEGGTGSGKTSILDAIDACFFGPKDRVIRDASRPSRFLITTEEYEFERTIIAGDNGEPKTKTFAIRRGDVSIKAPATFAKKVVRAQSMRPLVFFEASPAERRAILLRALPIELSREDLDRLADEAQLAMRENDPDFEGFPIDVLRELAKLPHIDWEAHAFDIAKRIYEAAYDTRHRIGQQLEGKRSIISGIKALTKAPYDAVRHETAKGTLLTLNTERTSLDTWNVKDQNILASSKYLEDTIKERERRIEALNAELAVEYKLLTDEQKVLDANKEDLKAVRASKAELLARLARYAMADGGCREDLSINARIEDWQAEEKRWADIEAANANVDRQTTVGAEHVEREVEALEAKRADYNDVTKFAENYLPALLIGELERNGGLPLKGLSIAGDRISFDGKSIDVLSSGERMHFCMKLTLAILHPLQDEDTLKLICVDDFERLDPELQAVVASYERPGDVQFIKTRVKTGALTETLYDPPHVAGNGPGA